jgi:hypothetical protein
VPIPEMLGEVDALPDKVDMEEAVAAAGEALGLSDSLALSDAETLKVGAAREGDTDEEPLFPLAVAAALALARVAVGVGVLVSNMPGEAVPEAVPAGVAVASVAGEAVPESEAGAEALAAPAEAVAKGFVALGVPVPGTNDSVDDTLTEKEDTGKVGAGESEVAGEALEEGDSGEADAEALA